MLEDACMVSFPHSGDHANALLHYEKGITKSPEVNVYNIHTVYFIHILHTCSINNHFKVYWLVYIYYIHVYMCICVNVFTGCRT